MKCILHIGTEKTATTTIQEFLHRNRQTLFQLGYLYTKATGSRNNWNLPVAAYDVSRRDDLTRLRGIYTDENLLNYQKKTIEQLRKEVDSAGAFKLTVFSSEYIQSRLTTSGEVSRLRILLNQIGYDDIQILVYLRRPVDIAKSLYSTSVKCGATAASPPSPKNKYYRNICDHRGTLKRFSDVFGETAVRPRIYSRDEFKNGCIISDFLASIGLESTQELFEVPTNHNDHLSALGLEILRRVNHRVPLFVDERLNQLRGNLVKYFSNYFKDGYAYTMPEELFWQYEMEFEESNEWVRRKYFPERDCLFCKTIYPNVVEVGLSQEELESIANMIATMWLEKETMVTKLTHREKNKVTKAIGYFKQWVKRIL